MNEKYITDERPISESCGCPVCRSHSRAYLRHLFKADEVLALRLAVLHNLWFYNELTARILELAERGGLTPRETEVFDLLARGRSIPYVRDALVISRETAATHAKHVYAKLDVHSRQELIDLVH